MWSSVSHFYAHTNLALQTDLAGRHWYFILVAKQFTSQILLIIAITYCIAGQMRCSLAVLSCSKTSKYTLSDCNFYFLFSNHFNILDFCPIFNSCGDYFHVCITKCSSNYKTALCFLHLAPFILHLILKPVSQSCFILAILRGEAKKLSYFLLLIIHLIWYLFRKLFEALNRYFIFHLYDGKIITNLIFDSDCKKIMRYCCYNFHIGFFSIACITMEHYTYLQ